MSELSQRNPTGRFSGLANVYARCRPSYPAAAIGFILQHCQLKSGSVLVDVGSGTGISSRLFAERGLQVIGIEPNAEMRAAAGASAISPGAAAPTYLEGRAEATSLAGGSADAVLAAQAFHWFDVERALQEFHRILRPGGWVILLWNERDERDAFTAAYGAVIRTVPEAATVEAPRGQAGEPLLTSPLFHNASRTVFANEQPLDEEGVLGRAFSASYAPREPAQAEQFAARLHDVFARFQRDGKVVLKYETAVYLAAREN
ncbi:MAG TPA: class I SAM-dependent methyltransferase [Gemmataceae bacterium]|nr:class I SAM-dependent methyltransferase [Gemmataceae bacterium]